MSKKVSDKREDKGSSATKNEAKIRGLGLVKEFSIQEVIGAYVENAPYRIVFDSGFFREEKKESSLTLNAETAARHGIPLSLDLVGRTLIASFQSHELLLEDEKRMNWGAVSADSVTVKSLEKKEEVSLAYFQLPSGKNTKVSRTLELQTHTSSGRFSSVPCPFYHFFLELTEEEYRKCKALPANTAFQVSLSLKAVEVSEPAEQGAS